VNKDERALKRALGLLAGGTLSDAERRWVVGALTATERRTLEEFWPGWAHEGQLAPKRGQSRVTVPGEATWLILAGRGFGKTRAGAEWVSDLARDPVFAQRAGASLRIALVGATIEDARKVMVEGRSGLLAVARTGEALHYARTAGVVRFPSGAEAYLYSGACPEKLRGPEHHFAWCDEIAKWRHAEAAWDNLRLGLRLGVAPRALVTTTPKASALLRRLAGEAAAVGTLSQGRMQDNLNLPPAFVAGMEADYRGTRKGREELDGELLGEAEGALWTRALIEACRIGVPLSLDGGGRVGVPSSETPGGSRCPPHPQSPPIKGREALRRIVIGVDPPASAEGDACGIVACAVDGEGVGYVLGDHSVSGLSPEGWASAVVAAARAWGADCVIVEKNQGGDMVKAVLRSADRELPARDVFARYGKGDRAEPVAMLFEGGRVKLAGSFPELEDELCALTRGGGWAGPGRSPDRADAMVWALTELLLGKEGMEPTVRRL
jgi:phage terminase large subunit-like protein